MSQDGGDPIEQLKEAAVNIYTGGTVGLKRGNLDIKSGAAVRAVDEGIGEISGRNLAREALNEQKSALQDEAKRKSQQLKEEQARKQRGDIQASQAAGNLRLQRLNQQQSILGTADAGRDFLGL